MPQLTTVTGISSMVAPVVLVTTSVIIANALQATMHSERGAPMVRRLYIAMMILFGAIALFILSVFFIALAIASVSDDWGAVAVWLILAGLVCLLFALAVIALAYARVRRL